MYSINPKHQLIDGRPCLASLGDLPERPEVAICPAAPAIRKGQRRRPRPGGGSGMDTPGVFIGGNDTGRAYSSGVKRASSWVSGGDHLSQEAQRLGGRLEGWLSSAKPGRWHNQSLGGTQRRTAGAKLLGPYRSIRRGKAGARGRVAPLRVSRVGQRPLGVAPCHRKDAQFGHGSASPRAELSKGTR